MIFYIKKNIITFFIFFILSSACYSQGILLFEKDLKNLKINCNKKTVIEKFGAPTIKVKSEEGVDILCYYFLSYSNTLKYGTKRRCVFVYFKDDKYLSYKIY